MGEDSRTWIELLCVDVGACLVLAFFMNSRITRVMRKTKETNKDGHKVKKQRECQMNDWNWARGLSEELVAQLGN